MVAGEMFMHLQSAPCPDITKPCHTHARLKKQQFARPLSQEEDSPNPSTNNFFNMPVSDAEIEQSVQQTNILKVLWYGGPGEGVFFKTPLPPEIFYA